MRRFRSIQGVHFWRCLCGSRCSTGWRMKDDALKELASHRGIAGCNLEAITWVNWAFPGATQQLYMSPRKPPATKAMIEWYEQHPNMPMPPQVEARLRGLK